MKMAVERQLDREELLHKLREKHPTLSNAYFDLLRRSAGIEGELAIEPGWIQLWSEDVALRGSEEYGVPQYLPGYFAIGGNGGGELFVISLHETNPAVFKVPAVELSIESLVQVAPTLVALERAILRRS